MTDSLPFSVCVITRDEEANIERCLRSVDFAGDVVVLDSGSTDATCDLARRRGARVFVEEWRGNIQQKQRAIELAEHQWILILDADEALSSELRDEITARFQGGAPDSAGFELPRKTHYLGALIEHSGWWPEYLVRLFDKDRAHFEGSDPHGHLVVDGGTQKLRGPLYHYAYRDLAHHLQKINDYTSTMARGMKQRGKRFRITDALFRPPGRFLRMYVLKLGFLDGWRGFVIATLGAFYVFLKYVKLWDSWRRGGNS